MTGRILILAILLLGSNGFLTGCSSPFLLLPGKSLQGFETDAQSWEFAEKFKILQLETRPQNPYSVYLRVVTKNGRLYIDAAKHRRWHDYIRQDPHVRIKLGNNIYRAIAIRVTEPEERRQFKTKRTIYRLDLVNRSNRID